MPPESRTHRHVRAIGRTTAHATCSQRSRDRQRVSTGERVFVELTLLEYPRRAFCPCTYHVNTRRIRFLDNSDTHRRALRCLSAQASTLDASVHASTVEP